MASVENPEVLANLRMQLLSMVICHGKLPKGELLVMPPEATEAAVKAAAMLENYVLRGAETQQVYGPGPLNPSTDRPVNPFDMTGGVAPCGNDDRLVPRGQFSNEAP